MFKKSIVTKVFLFLFALFPNLYSVDSYAQSRIFGQDVLAIQQPRFGGQGLLPFVTSGTALGSLDTTFGTSLAPIIILLNSGKFSYYRVHLINGSCIANQNCGSYEIGKGYNLKSFEAAVLARNSKILSYLSSRAKAYCSLRAQFPNVKLLISPVVEHRLGTSAFRITADTILGACPGVTVVNNPVTGRGERYKGAWIESHSSNITKADIYSYDGYDATDSNVRAWIQQTALAKIAFIWSRTYNCRNLGVFQDPRKRTSCPKLRDFEMLGHITDVRAPAIPPSFTCQAFKAPNIWKPLAEDTGSKDPRANLPVAIVPFKASDVYIVTAKGMVLGTMKYYGPYQGNLNRYYAGMPGGIGIGGYQIEKKSTGICGSPWIYLRQGALCLGPIVPGKRNGLFR